jgi:hypothetical protein
MPTTNDEADCTQPGCTAWRLKGTDYCMNHQPSSPGDPVTQCWVAGLLLVLVGSIVAGSTFPDAVDGLGYSETGSQGGFVFGLLLLVAGQIFLLIAIVATGVRLGIQSDRARSTPVS